MSVSVVIAPWTSETITAIAVAVQKIALPWMLSSLPARMAPGLLMDDEEGEGLASDEVD